VLNKWYQAVEFDVKSVRGELVAPAMWTGPGASCPPRTTWSWLLTNGAT